MSSLKNAIPRRAHKERGQPADRKRYGLLEKHKDYVLRARDYHKKEDAIRKLQEKAAFRNPDEFYFKMQNAVTRDGIHQAKAGESNKYTPEELLLMKTQDMRYVLNKAQAETKKVERLRAALQSIGSEPSNKHIVFADDSGEADEGLGPSTSGGQSEAAAPTLAPLPKRLQKQRDAAYRELEERAKRAKTMRRLVQKMALKKELMGKGRKRKLNQEDLDAPGKGAVHKWKRERKQ